MQLIDLHCHILPGVDDGAQTLEDSLKMADSAMKNGITHILCTPHHNRQFDNPREKVLHAVEALQAEFDKRQIDITLFECQEVRIHGELEREIQQGRILTADVGGRYLMIEFPSAEIPDYAERLLFLLAKKGYTPIIVHPERNKGFQAEPNRLINFLNAGCLAQLTAPSITGSYGKQTQKIAKQMVEAGLVQMMASDAHRVENRDFEMKQGFQIITKEFGEAKTAAFQQTARDIINGDLVIPRDYQEVREQKSGWFR